MAEIRLPLRTRFDFDGNIVEGVPTPTGDDHAVNREYITTYIIDSDQIAGGAITPNKLSQVYNDEIGTNTNIDTSGAQVIDEIVLAEGVVKSFTYRNLTPADIGAEPAQTPHTRAFGGHLVASPSATQVAASSLTWTIQYTGVTNGFTYRIINFSVEDTTNFSITRASDNQSVTVTYSGGASITSPINTTVHITADTEDTTQSPATTGYEIDTIDISVSVPETRKRVRVGTYMGDSDPSDDFTSDAGIESALDDEGFITGTEVMVEFEANSGDRTWVAVDDSLQLTGWFSLPGGASTNDIDIFTTAQGGGSYNVGSYTVYYTRRGPAGTGITAYITVE